MKVQWGKATVKESGVQRGTIEGVVLVNGRPQIERADMPLVFSFDSIEELERFCKDAKKSYEEQIAH